MSRRHVGDSSAVLEKAALQSATSDGYMYATPPQNLLTTNNGSSQDAQAVATRAGGERARPTTPHVSSGFVGFPVDQPRDARILKILEESRHRMLSAADIRTLILAADPFTERPDTGTPDWAIYKECPKQRRRAKNSDRWANSGGMKGSRDLPYNSPRPFVRRRYGSVFYDASGKGKRYYEYTLLHQRDDGTTYEDKSASLFHILPGPGETDRGRRVMANDNDSSCDQQPPQLRLQPQPHINAHAPVQNSEAADSAVREMTTTPASQLVPLQTGSFQDHSKFVGMDMLSAAAALRLLGSATP